MRTMFLEEMGRTWQSFYGHGHGVSKAAGVADKYVPATIMSCIVVDWVSIPARLQYVVPDTSICYEQ